MGRRARWGAERGGEAGRGGEGEGEARELWCATGAGAWTRCVLRSVTYSPTYVRAQVALTVKGAIPVLISVKAIALAQDYVKEDGIDIKFAVQFRDLEDPELNNTPSTYLHMAIIPRNV
jgi:stage V sporulation protein SpoVS